MALTQIVPSRIGPTFDALQISASISETHAWTADIPDHQLETGSAITDSRTVRPVEVTMEGVITGTPSIPEENEESDFLDHQKGYETLLQLFQGGDPFVVTTGLQVYENMVFSSLSIPRETSTGVAVRFRAVLKQIRFANSETIPVSDLIPKAQPVQNRGPKATPPARPETADASRGQLQSTLSKIFEGF